MPDESTPNAPEEQVARAKRLRERIEALKSGRPVPADPQHRPSLREQVEERSQDDES
jgi:hypothetical protein